MKKKILVLGGGITGLGVAIRLQERGFDVEVIEKHDEIGGLSATKKVGDYSLDFGPHFILSEDKKTLNDLIGFLNYEMPTFERKAKLYFNGRYYNYPLTARNVLLQMPFKDAAFCALSYLARQILKIFIPKNDNPNFERWAKDSFGNYLYKLFFKPYTEQFWRLPCPTLSPDSIPTNTRLSFYKTLKLLFVKNIVKSSISVVERETTLPLRYPKKGIGELTEAMANRIRQNKGAVHTACSVKLIRREMDNTYGVIADKNGTEIQFTGDEIVSTMPITEMVQMLDPLPSAEVMESASRLGFLSLKILYLITNNKDILDTSYLYNVKRPYNRMAEMNKFSPSLSPRDENMLALELSCHVDDEIWNMEDYDLYERCIKYLSEDKILKKSDVKKYFVLRAQHAYPIYYHDYKPHLNRLLSFVDQTPGLYAVGRSGRYMYMDIDQCWRKGIDAANRVK